MESKTRRNLWFKNIDLGVCMGKRFDHAKLTEWLPVVNYKNDGFAFAHMDHDHLERAFYICLGV